MSWMGQLAWRSVRSVGQYVWRQKETSTSCMDACSISTTQVLRTYANTKVGRRRYGGVHGAFCIWYVEYKLKRCSNKECCKQCRYVMFKGTMTKWPVQKLTQRTTQILLQHHDATDIQTNYIFVFFGFFFSFLLIHVIS